MLTTNATTESATYKMRQLLVECIFRVDARALLAFFYCFGWLSLYYLMVAREFWLAARALLGYTKWLPAGPSLNLLISVQIPNPKNANP